MWLCSNLLSSLSSRREVAPCINATLRIPWHCADPHPDHVGVSTMQDRHLRPAPAARSAALRPPRRPRRPRPPPPPPPRPRRPRHRPRPPRPPLPPRLPRVCHRRLHRRRAGPLPPFGRHVPPRGPAPLPPPLRLAAHHTSRDAPRRAPRALPSSAAGEGGGASARRGSAGRPRRAGCAAEQRLAHEPVAPHLGRRSPTDQRQAAV
mmetsp:Transcript_49041/g.158907  ORF Transcript_49041/g.158907 Transcript_49041/m.158907 type:complete len:206 (-) Transcript_49041:619-1236(-)